MKRIVTTVSICLILARCSNIGFVEKAKAVANNTFGVEVFAAGGTDMAQSLLTSASSGLSTSCVGIAGIDKANCACSVIAQQRSFTGTFRAWVSISGTVDAICNIQGQVATGCSVSSELGPFIARNSSGVTVLAADYAELSTSGFRVALENSLGLVITGTGIDGRATGADCGGFQVSSGNAYTAGDKSKSGAAFTSGEIGVTCNTGAGTILCMRQPK